MQVPYIVIDTNVLVAALRSNQGASFQLLSLIDKNLFRICVSVPLVLEYEEVLLRYASELRLTAEEVGTLLDYLCSVAEPQPIFFLWRPFLRDPKDDMMLELAVNAACQFIVTFNKKDFANVQHHFGIEVISPAQFLKHVLEII